MCRLSERIVLGIGLILVIVMACVRVRGRVL